MTHHEQTLENLLGILQHLDGPRFRVIVEADDSVSDADIIEAMHRARLEHAGINRLQKQASKRWLQEHEL